MKLKLLRVVLSLVLIASTPAATAMYAVGTTPAAIENRLRDRGTSEPPIVKLLRQIAKRFATPTTQESSPIPPRP